MEKNEDSDLLELQELALKHKNVKRHVTACLSLCDPNCVLICGQSGQGHFGHFHFRICHFAHYI